MDVREATGDDVEAIRRVARASWEADEGDVLTRESIDEGFEEWYAADRLRELLDRPRTLLLVADDGEPVGFAHAVWEGDEGDVLRLYVHPDRREEGVGRRLLDRTCEALFDRGVDRVEAMVLAANDPGCAFYSDAGFRRVGTAETEIGPDVYEEHTYAMERE